MLPHRSLPITGISIILLAGFLVDSLPVTPAPQTVFTLPSPERTQVLILGGGVAGIIAARTLQERGVSDFIIVEARTELGGRLLSHTFGEAGRDYTIELGANWVQGTYNKDTGRENPIWTLSKKHRIETRESAFFGGIDTYDETGRVNFTAEFKQAEENYDRLVTNADVRVKEHLVDATARTGYSLLGAQPTNHHEVASEYYNFDWEFGQSPEETSWLASSWATTHTFDSDADGFSDVNLMSVDPRGFKTFIQAEAQSFLQSPKQVMLGATVREIAYSSDGVQVHLADGRTLKANYSICTFSLGVLQHKDVVFTPALPDWKQEAIHSMAMGVYTKIFIQFPYKFWFETESALYADRERGRYTVWHSLDHPNYLPDSGLLVVTVTGDFSKRIESLPDAEVQAEVLGVLRKMYPAQAETMPEPTAFYFHRWFRDPLFRGAFSNWPASFLSEHHTNVRANVEERLWFAGEATSKFYFGEDAYIQLSRSAELTRCSQGYLQGAYFEGMDIALEVANCINGNGCVGLEHVEKVRNARPYNI
ncbi:hypothetical protein NLI96_g8812 [Meripilus lineatus]|uniref:Amine oxidase n=1 Tax=Meripilus lineatus TaxID=2056292 RepID=A0AAD5V1V0_9APHY|nr:hypothetical protein NLI96_g8812 [Physisporinus lineatus]